MLNLKIVEYDEGSKEVQIKFTDDNGNEVLTIMLFKKEAWNLHKMLQEKLKFVKRHRL